MRRPVLDVVLPVRDEAAVLAASVERVAAHLADVVDGPWRIVVADNGSADATPRIAARLAAERPEVEAFSLPSAGRGGALRAAWRASAADVVAYMDVDLSTDLRALAPLVAPLIAGTADVAVGTRLAPGAEVERGPKREVLSRAYNGLLRTVLDARFTDAQCGFKALRADAARRLLPAVRDDAWFFDTELLLLAQRAGLRLHEVPVRWTDDPDSRVAIPGTVAAALRGVVRLHAARRAADVTGVPGIRDPRRTPTTD